MINTITNKMFALVVAVVMVFGFTVSVSQASAELEALLLGLGLTQSQVDAVLMAMDDGGEEGTCTAGYVHHPDVDYEFTQFMKYGSRGTEVEMLQTVLADRGAGAADGIFGNMTKTAVMSFQADNGLVADGYVGAMTRAELNKMGECDEEEENTVDGDMLMVEGEAADDMIVGDGQTVVFTELTFTAGDEDVKVKNVLVEWSGTGDHDDYIDEVLLLDSAMLEVDSDTLDSDDEAKLSADKMVEAGESLTMYLAALTDITGSDGLTGSLEVTDVTTDGADVDGLPIEGAQHEFNDGVAVDEFDAEITKEETSDVHIGDDAVEVATVNVQNESAGDDPQYVKSIQLTRTGTATDDALENVEIEVMGDTYTSTQDDDEYVFNFGEGIELEEEGDDEDFTVFADVIDDSGTNFGFDLTDIVVVDEDGVLLVETDGLPDGEWDYGTTIDIIDSEVAIDGTDEVDDDEVAAGAEGVDLASYDVEVTGKDVEGDLEVDIEVTVGAAVDGNDIDLDNLALYLDDERVSDFEDTNYADQAGAGSETVTVTFSNVMLEASDDEVEYILKGDISKDAPTGTTYQVVETNYTNIEDEDGEDIADVQELSDLATIEVQSSALEVSVEEPDETEVNGDEDNVIVVNVELDATDSGDDVYVTEITLDMDITGTTVAEVTNCNLFDGNDDISSEEDGAATMTFDVDVEVTKDTTKVLTLVCDLGDDFVNGDVIDVDGNAFEAYGLVTGVDLDAAATGTDEGVTITEGDVDFAITTDDENDNKVVRDNADDVVLGVYEFTAENAELTIDDITVTFTGNVHDLIASGDLDVYIDGAKKDTDEVTDVNPSVAAFTTLGVVVGLDDTVTIEFKADADAAGTVEIDSVDVTTEELVGTDTEGTDGPTVTISAAIPIVTQIDEDKDLETDNDVTLFAYKVEADGGDIAFGGTVFTVLTSAGVDLLNARVEVYDTADMSGSAELEVDISATVDGAGEDVVDVDLTDLTLSENDTYWVFLIADTDSVEEGDSVRVTVYDDDYNGTADNDGAYEADGTVGLFFDSVAADNEYDATDLQGSLLIDGDMKSLLVN